MPLRGEVLSRTVSLVLHRTPEPRPSCMQPHTHTHTHTHSHAHARTHICELNVQPYFSSVPLLLVPMLSLSEKSCSKEWPKNVPSHGDLHLVMPHLTSSPATIFGRWRVPPDAGPVWSVHTLGLGLRSTAAKSLPPCWTCRGPRQVPPSAPLHLHLKPLPPRDPCLSCGGLDQ